MEEVVEGAGLSQPVSPLSPEAIHTVSLMRGVMVEDAAGLMLGEVLPWDPGGSGALVGGLAGTGAGAGAGVLVTG